MLRTGAPLLRSAMRGRQPLVHCADPEPMGTTTAMLNFVYWRGRAQEARTRADTMKWPEARRTMLIIAAGYDRLADMEENERATEVAESIHSQPGAGKNSHSN